MKVVRATSMGMCFGVRDALAAARRVIEPVTVTINGELVHNPVVKRELCGRGFVLAHEGEDAIPETMRVLITAHGVSDRRRAALQAAGKELIDTTCPLVRKAHTAALRLDAEGFHVLVIGKPGHVEVRGLTGDLAAYDVLESPADVREWPHHKLGLIAQTTFIERDAAQIVAAVRRRNPASEVRFVNTVCQPTRDRQNALDELLQAVDVLVVVGGHNSNNTRRLVQRARERDVPAIHVEHAAQIDERDFVAWQVVGLTAGTSALPETIEEVRRCLEALHTPISREVA